jgi:hypothetical protein
MIALLMTKMVAAQSPQTASPVDQAVADLDPLSTSLRHVETGLRFGGEQSSLYRLHQSNPALVGGQTFGADPAMRRYERVSPGTRAHVDRVDYLVRADRQGVEINVQPVVDGRFIELISANTVYVLDPLAGYPQPPAQADFRDMRIDARIDARVNGRIDGRADRRTRAVPGHSPNPLYDTISPHGPAWPATAQPLDKPAIDTGPAERDTAPAEPTPEP